MNITPANYQKKLADIKNAKRISYDNDINNIANGLAESILNRINRVVNMDSLSDEDKSTDINPEYMTVRPLDLHTENVSCDDFGNYRVLDHIKCLINKQLNPQGFTVYHVTAPSSRMGSATISFNFGVYVGFKNALLEGFYQAFRTAFYFITGQWHKI